MTNKMGGVQIRWGLLLLLLLFCHRTAKFKELLSTMQRIQDLRVNKTGGIPAVPELTGWWGTSYHTHLDDRCYTGYWKPTAEKLNLFRVSRKALITVMLKSTDCDSQRLMQWVMGAGEEKGTRPRDFCTKLQDTTRQRRCSGHKVSFRWPVYRLRLLQPHQETRGDLLFIWSLSSQIIINQAPTGCNLCSHY